MLSITSTKKYSVNYSLKFFSTNSDRWSSYASRIQQQVLWKNQLPAETNFKSDNYGFVVSVSDGIVKVIGLNFAVSGELVKISSPQSDSNSVFGVIMNLEKTYISVLLFGRDRSVLPGYVVSRTNSLIQFLVNESLLGSVIDSLGNKLDEVVDVAPISNFGQLRQVDLKAPGIMPRRKVTQPLNTGILLIDSLIPIGLGQRELVIGDRQIGKTSLVLDIMINQAWHQTKKNRDLDKALGVISIYVAIGQKQSSIVQIREALLKYGALHNTCIVASTASDAASLQFLAPYSGCAIGEYFRDSGQHALVIYDDLSKHAVAYRQISLLLRRSPGREAYPGDVFYLHSRLLERAAKLNNNFGGGSLTALPIIETLAGDVSAYIPTNVISITDGQVFLEKDLFYKGFRPAVNVGLSVSRIGAAAQVPALKAIAGSLKLELAQFREVETFITFGADDVDEITKKILHRGLRLVKLLVQPRFFPLLAAQQAVLIYAGTNGFLDSLSMPQVDKFKDFIFYGGEKMEGFPGAFLNTWDMSKKLDKTNLDNVVKFILSNI